MQECFLLTPSMSIPNALSKLDTYYLTLIIHIWEASRLLSHLLMLIYVEPGWGFFVEHLENKNGVEVGPVFFPSTLHPSNADMAFQKRVSYFQNSPNQVHLQASSNIRQANSPHSWKELLKSHYHIPRFSVSPMPPTLPPHALLLYRMHRQGSVLGQPPAGEYAAAPLDKHL